MMRDRSSRRRGAHTLEFALTMPAFALFFFGIMEMGWLFWNQVAVQESVRQACRAGAVVPAIDEPLAEHTARWELQDRLRAFGVPCASGCVLEAYQMLGPPEELLVCRADVPYRGLTGAVPMPETLRAQATVFLELQR